MNCKKGSFLAEAIVACFIAAITVLSAVSIIRLSIILVSESKDKLAAERAREMALSLLSSGEPPPDNCYPNITIIRSSGSQQVSADIYKIKSNTYRGERESFVLWPYEKE